VSLHGHYFRELMQYSKLPFGGLPRLHWQMHRGDDHQSHLESTAENGENTYPGLAFFDYYSTSSELGQAAHLEECRSRSFVCLSNFGSNRGNSSLDDRAMEEINKGE
jgi:hypothetical protein